MATPAVIDASSKVPPKEPKETAIALKGLAPTTTEGTLKTMYAAYGQVLRVKMDKHGGAHVVFASTRAAQRAAETTNGAMVDGKTIRAGAVRTFAKTTRPCRSFQEGTCRKGDACKYWHPSDGTAPSATGVSAPPTIKSTASKRSAIPTAPRPAEQENGDDISGIPKDSICRNFAKGKCAQGETCRFAHVLGAGPLPPPAPASIPAPCAFYKAGRCSRGTECAFLHTDAPALPPASKKTPCAYFAAGRCARGEQCAYLHETPTPTTKKVKKEKPAKQQKTVTAVATTPKKLSHVAPTASVSDADRTCIECEQPGVAVWRCSSCDNAKYCDGCNTLVHQAKVLRSHARSKLPPVVKAPVCGECEKKDGVTKCEDCGVVYCKACDASVHQFKSLRGHKRTLVSTASTSKSTPVVTTASSQGYVDSVPQYDLSSESDSDSESEEEEEEAATPVVTRQPSPEASESDDESSSSEDEQPAAAALSAYVNSVPKFDLSSDSESSDDEAADEAKAPVAVSKQSPPVDVSSESSDDDFEDERPRFTAQPGSSTTATAPVSSESSSESDSDDDEPMAQAPPPVKRPQPVQQLSSESESSDDDVEVITRPVVKQQRVTAVIQRPAPTQAAAPAKVGISSGSSHSLVKKIEAYAASGNTEVLHLDPNLNGFERLLAHDCAERLGLHHISVGEGLERHITVSRGGVAQKRSAPAYSGAVAKKRSKQS